jgi:hypothetical protein
MSPVGGNFKVTYPGEKDSQWTNSEKAVIIRVHLPLLHPLCRNRGTIAVQRI